MYRLRNSDKETDVEKQRSNIMFIKELVKRIAWGKRYSSETYIAYLRSRGIKIGKDVTIYVPTKTVIDETRPWMISIGDHVRITEGCKILTHDFAWSVPKTISGGGIRSIWES